MSVGTYFKQNWFILLLTVGFGAWGVYASLLSHETRDPIFVVDADRVEILSAARVADAPIKVMRRDNTPIHSDVYAVRFYFWNAGKRSIRPENVLEPIRVALDSESEILDSKVLKISRPITHARLVASPPAPGPRALLIVFGILERNDGLTVQIIYQGRRNAPLTVSGTIEGVPAGISNPRAASFWSIVKRKAWKIVSGTLLVGLVFALMARGRRPPAPAPRATWGEAIAAGVFVALLALVASVILASLNRLDDPPASVVTMVPPALSQP